MYWVFERLAQTRKLRGSMCWGADKTMSYRGLEAGDSYMLRIKRLSTTSRKFCAIYPPQCHAPRHTQWENYDTVHLLDTVCLRVVLTTNSWARVAGDVDGDGRRVDSGVHQHRLRSISSHGGRRWTAVGGRASDVLWMRSTDQGPLVAERRRPVVARELPSMFVLSVRPRRRRVDSVRARRPSALSPWLPQVLYRYACNSVYDSDISDETLTVFSRYSYS